jgi:methionyl-tRNA formyltransferase
MTLVLLTKKDLWSQQAAKLVQAVAPMPVIWQQGQPGDAAPAAFDIPSITLLISFLSPWIVPADVLERSKDAINFHPGSCDYPGTGCYNFALYEGAAQFGAVCHHMLPRVDTGEVIAETLFPVLPHDRVETLKLRTMVTMLEMLHIQLSRYATGDPFTRHHRQWTRPAFTRRQLNALCEITEAMPPQEKQRRILATTYPGYPGPYLLKDGKKIPYDVPAGSPLA